MGLTQVEEEQRLIKYGNEWQKKAMRYEQAMNENNQRAMKAEAELKAVKRRLYVIEHKMHDIMVKALENAMETVLAEAQTGREE